MKSLLAYIATVLHKPAVRISFFFMVGSMSANVANWLFNLLAGRVLSNEDFAVLTVFLSLFSIINVPANAIATTVSRYTAYQKEQKDKILHASFLQHYSKVAFLFGIVISAVFILGAAQIKNFFSLPSIEHIFLFAPAILLLFLTAFQRGVLKGHLLLIWVGVLMATEAVIKVLTIVIVNIFQLPILPFVIASLPLSVLVNYLISRYLTKKMYPQIIEKKENISFSDTYGFLTNSFIASIGMVLLNGIDMLLVKHHFDPSIAGTYAILSLFGKILFFGGGGLIELFVPFVASANGKGETGLKQFISLVLTVGSIAGATLLVFLLFPEFIVNLFIGDKALSVLPYLATYSIGVFFLILISCFNVFNIAKKDFLPSRLIILAVILETVLISFMHGSLLEIVNIVTSINIGLFIIIFIYSLVTRNKIIKQQNPSNSQNVLFLVTLMLQNWFNKSKKIKIKPPQQIDTYSYVKSLETPGLKRPHVIALYKDTTGRQAIAKIWQGSAKNFDYYALKNEAHIYQVFTAALKRKKVPKNLEYISLPMLIKVFDTDTSFILLTEFVKGELATNIQSSQKLSLYLDCVAYLRFVGNHLTSQEKQGIGQRTFKDYVLLFPLLFAVSMIRRPQQIIQLLKGMLLFFQSIPSFFQQKNLVLTHRDLHFNNIIVSKNRVYILDLQRCIYTYDLYEYVTTLPIEWNEEIFRSGLLDYCFKQSKMQTGNHKLLKGLMANFCIHGLTANNLPEINMQRFTKMLLFTINT